MSELSYLEKLLDGAEVEWLTAAEIFNIKNGYTPSKAKKEFWEDGNIPWFRLEDIRTNGRELNDSIMHVNQAGVKGNLFHIYVNDGNNRRVCFGQNTTFDQSANYQFFIN